MAELLGSGAAPPRRRTAKIAAVSALALYGIGAVLLFLWPDGEHVRLLMINLWYAAKGLGLPAWISPEVFALGANTVAFVPGSCALAVLSPRLEWWTWGLLAVAVSAGIELTQLVFLGSRVPDVTDVLANGLGGFLGAALGHWFTRSTNRTDADVA